MLYVSASLCQLFFLLLHFISCYGKLNAVIKAYHFPQNTDYVFCWILGNICRFHEAPNPGAFNS